MYVFLDPFFCNFVRPKTSDNNFREKKIPKSIMPLSTDTNTLIQ